MWRPRDDGRNARQWIRNICHVARAKSNYQHVIRTLWEIASVETILLCNWSSKNNSYATIMQLSLESYNYYATILWKCGELINKLPHQKSS